VDIQVLPTSTDFASTVPRSVSIHLVRPGVILPPNPSVKSSFLFSPAQPTEDAPVIFDGSGSSGANLTYAWTFGDGATGIGVRSTHSYSVAGNYSVVLTVTDDRGTTDSSNQSVIVTAAADPTAEFTSSPTAPIVNGDVFFDGSLSTTPSGTGRTIASYDWNFGDGQSGSGQKVSHKYGAAGSYVVVLNVRDSTGRRGTIAHSVTVK
jgi:PKD repeat protein